MVTFGGRIAHRHWQHAIYHGFTAIPADHLWTVAFVKYRVRWSRLW